MLTLSEFNILPHPAKTNNPSDLNQEPEERGGLQSASANAYNARGPHVPEKEIAEGLEAPKSREEVSSFCADTTGMHDRSWADDAAQGSG